MDMYPDDYCGGAVYMFIPLYAVAAIAVAACDIYRVERYDDRLVAYAYNLFGNDLSNEYVVVWRLAAILGWSVEWLCKPSYDDIGRCCSSADLCIAKEYIGYIPDARSVCRFGGICADGRYNL